MQKTDQPDWFCPLFNFFKNLVYHLLSCSGPGQVLSLLHEGFYFKLDRKSRTAHVHISKGGCFRTVLIYLLLSFGDSEGWDGRYCVTSWCDTSYREPTRGTIILSHSSCNPCFRARDLLGLVISNTQKESHCLLWVKKWNREGEDLWKGNLRRPK